MYRILYRFLVPGWSARPPGQRPRPNFGHPHPPHVHAQAEQGEAARKPAGPECSVYSVAVRRLPKLLDSRRPALVGLVAATVALAVVAALLVPADTALLSLTGAESAAALDPMADETVGEALPSPLTRGRSAAAHAIVDAHKAVSVGPPRASDPSGEAGARGGVEARLSLRSHQSQPTGTLMTLRCSAAMDFSRVPMAAVTGLGFRVTPMTDPTMST